MIIFLSCNFVSCSYISNSVHRAVHRHCDTGVCSVNHERVSELHKQLKRGAHKLQIVDTVIRKLYYVDCICPFIVEELHAEHGPKRRGTMKVIRCYMSY